MWWYTLNSNSGFKKKRTDKSKIGKGIQKYTVSWAFLKMNQVISMWYLLKWDLQDQAMLSKHGLFLITAIREALQKPISTKNQRYLLFKHQYRSLEVLRIQLLLLMIWKRRNLTLKNFMAPFYGWGSTALRLQPLRGGSLLFTTICRRNNRCISPKVEQLQG